jgi:spore maturation protein CgeB
MKILLGYSWYPYEYSVGVWVEAWLARLRSHGIEVDGFCLTLDPPGPCIYWPELDDLWQRHDKNLMSMYDNLARRLESYDVFVNWNGINLHPEFVQQIPIFKAYACFDDPESSDRLSQPVASSYDLALVGNIAEVETYYKWGVKEARHWPLGFFSVDYDHSLTKEKILNGTRDVDLTLLCERISSWRKERLDKFAAAFPQGAYFGHGWPNGFLPDRDRIPLYQRSKIGINMHNSTGPINFRTFILPANGVMQFCDNKEHLGKLFELNKEVVGFDSIEEAIELCHYYLRHDDDRREIAAAGWERAHRDYNEVAVFKMMMHHVEEVRRKNDRALSPAESSKGAVDDHMARGKYAEAVALYGEVLAREPGNLRARHNRIVACKHFHHGSQWGRNGR